MKGTNDASSHNFAVCCLEIQTFGLCCNSSSREKSVRISFGAPGSATTGPGNLTLQ